MYQELGSDFLEKVSGGDNTVTTEKDIASFWKSIPLNDGGNSGNDYAHEKRRWDVDLLKDKIEQILPGEGIILDFGCNAGRILHVLVEKGYQGIGVEINPVAVEYGKKCFPSLQNVHFIIGDGAAVLKKIDTASVDLIYAVAVLRHISPCSIDIIAEELARISKQYIISLEDEGSLSIRTYPRNYKRIFLTKGYRQIYKTYAVDHFPLNQRVGMGTVMRVFEKVNAK